MIQANNLSFHYTTKKPVYQNLDLHIEPGKIYGILGKNGVGKTTLLKLINGLVFPKEGSLDVFGDRPQNRKVSFLNEIFYIREEIPASKLSIKKEKNLYAPFYPNFSEESHEIILSKFDLDPNEKISNLSFGQKKKAHLAFALATGCRLLLLDEPTNALDIPSKSQFRKVVSAHMHENSSILVSTHQVRDLSNLIDGVVIIEKGKIILNEDLFEISKKMAFVSSLGTTIPENAIYSERVPGGNIHVVPNTNQLETDIDLEVLFNAVLTEQSQFIKTLNAS